MHISTVHVTFKVITAQVMRKVVYEGFFNIILLLTGSFQTTAARDEQF